MIENKGKFTFPGGTHPPGNKLTRDCRIEPGPAVNTVAVMLSQHIGAVCEPIVEKQQPVKLGQPIGRSDAFVSAPIHSPINGTVKDITLWSHAVLGRSKAIVIEADPENNPPQSPCSKLAQQTDLGQYSSQRICDAVKAAGIVGMGGAGFPTIVKIQPNPRLPKETLIINGCECEPFITCDYRLMLEHSRHIVTGILLAKKAAQCSRVIIGIEDNKPDAIDAIRQQIEILTPDENIEIVPLKTKYPQGGERQLIKALLGKNVPTGGIPPMVGVVVLNVATVAAIAEAVVCGRPLTHRVVTVTGHAIANPGNYYVPIGTTVRELIDFCGPVTQKSAKVVLGGPMMGIALADLDTPVTKTSGAVTILTKTEIGKAKFARRQTPCIRCGRCLRACPEHLNPTVIAHAVKNNQLDIAKKYYINACIECGCCSYVCPANIEVTGYIKTGKIFLARQKQKIPG